MSTLGSFVIKVRGSFGTNVRESPGTNVLGSIGINVRGSAGIDSRGSPGMMVCAVATVGCAATARALRTSINEWCSQ
jgi:hypothetical protein